MLRILQNCWETFCLIVWAGFRSAQEGIGIISDFLDAIGIIGKIIATVGTITGTIYAFYRARWYVGRKKR